LLAGRMAWTFADTDSLLVAEKRTSIREIVERFGWEEFRRWECEVVRRVCAQHRQVVATGGGVVLDDANVTRMKAAGKIIWLRATPETIRKRMAQDVGTETFRPALTAKDSIAEIEDTLLERESCYQQAMDFSVDTDNRQIEEVCDTVIRHILSI